jgi:hypothetical protein
MEINQAEPKAMRINNKNKSIFTLDGKEIGNVDTLPHLGSIVTRGSGW